MVNMELNYYQLEALKSVAIKQKNVAALAHRSLGTAGEAGELANVIKKIIRDKNGKANEVDIEKITEKLGDTHHYIEYLTSDVKYI